MYVYFSDDTVSSGWRKIAPPTGVKYLVRVAKVHVRLFIQELMKTCAVTGHTYTVY